jgi:hypothetical protein
MGKEMIPNARIVKLAYHLIAGAAEHGKQKVIG